MPVGSPPMLYSARRGTVYTVCPDRSQDLVEMNGKHLARMDLVSFRSNQKLRDTLQRAVGSFRSEIMSYSVITPYRMSNDPGDLKPTNAGDGFILKAVMKLLEPYQCEHIFSSRVTLSQKDINKINSTRMLVLAGANQLNDNFSVIPGFNCTDLEQIKVPIVPMGIGINGEEGKNDGMSDETRSIMAFIHRRSKWSSWRCPLTMDYLHKNLPEMSDHFLLTGCPVMFLGEPGEHVPLSEHQPRTVVVTTTTRGKFWQRETQTIDFVHKTFPDARKILSQHQAPRDVKIRKRIKGLLKGNLEQLHTPVALSGYAKRRGFEIFHSGDAEDFLNLYRDADLHIGSRLHAHLFCLSLRKSSFVTYVDERMAGFSQMLQFPICDPGRLGDYMNFDFNICWQQIEAVKPTMDRFVSYLKDELLVKHDLSESDDRETG